MNSTHLDLSPFTQGYIEALFASLKPHPHSGEPTLPFPAGHGDAGTHIVRAFSDLAPETRARIIADCETYQSYNPALWTSLSDRRSRQFGRDFWTMRQNGNLPQQPPLTVQLGDDGKVRFV